MAIKSRLENLLTEIAQKLADIQTERIQFLTIKLEMLENLHELAITHGDDARTLSAIDRLAEKVREL